MAIAVERSPSVSLAGRARAGAPGWPGDQDDDCAGQHGAAGAGHMRFSKLGVSFGHFDVRMPEDLCELVEVPAVHHVPRCERMPEIMKTEALNFR
jgi:hypothetical protein